MKRHKVPFHTSKKILLPAPLRSGAGGGVSSYTNKVNLDYVNGLVGQALAQPIHHIIV